MHFLSSLFPKNSTLLRTLLQVKRQKPDRARRDHILNVLLAFSCVTLLFISVILILTLLFGSNANQREVTSPLTTLLLLVVCLFLLWLVRKGQGVWASGIFLFLSFIFPAYVSLVFGVSVPQSLLTFSLVIVMSGILLGSKQSLWVTFGINAYLLVLIYIQQNHIVEPMMEWRTRSPHVGNIVAYGICLTLIAVVSWLFNRQSERALKRSEQLESTLRHERDELEKTVYLRTQELRQAQAARINELYKMAEFGRQSSGIFHDIANPLNVVALSLDELKQSQKSARTKEELKNIRSSVRSAILATHKIEDYLKSSRLTLQSSYVKKRFSIVKEIKLAIKISEQKAKQAGVSFQVVGAEKSVYFLGSNIKFYQIISNLIANAIDAYENSTVSESRRIIRITLKKMAKEILILVSDQAGGITPTAQAHIFEPFFSTKKTPSHIGIGLAVCKTVIEQDFLGEIECRSQWGKGTTFHLSFPK